VVIVNPYITDTDIVDTVLQNLMTTSDKIQEWSHVHALRILCAHVNLLEAVFLGWVYDKNGNGSTVAI
jgi:hypothetical protein